MVFFEDELRTPVVVGELAAALLELADRDECGILHVAGPDTVSRYEFAFLLAQAHGLPGERILRGRLERSRPDRPANCALDSTRARRHLRTPARLRTGTAALVGARALVLERVDGNGGQVKIGGEVWSARAYDEDDVIEPGARVEVMQIDGATALVAE